MKVAFELPSTPFCKVLYHRGNVLQSATIETPSNSDGLISTMLARQVGVSQIKAIEPVRPSQPLRRGNPADHQLAKYASVAEH